MKKNVFETMMGAVVLMVAAGFIYIAYQSGTIAAPTHGYTLQARFDQVDGLNVGSDVRISGLKVGTITEQKVDPKTYQAVVTIALNNEIKVPKDSTALITSESLLGGKYLSIMPGADEEMLANGGVIRYTQSSVNLEQLLGKFAFGSVGGKDEKKAGSPDAAPSGDTGGNVPSL
jgi:phospholipid/cholesterol/gamma-HCH transport system substrate-binding protein